MNLDKRIDEILNNFMMEEEGVISYNTHPYIKKIKQLIEEEKIKELGNLLSKKDEFIPDLTFKKIKDRIKELENK